MSVRRSVRRGVWLALGIYVLGMAGCTAEPNQIELTRVPPPEGGSILTVEALSQTDRTGRTTTRLVAPSRSRLYVNSPGQRGWRAHEVDWPDHPDASGPSPLESIARASEPSNLPTRHLLTTHAGRIWLLARRGSPSTPVLLVSRDGGDSWTSARLPGRYRTATGAGGTRSRRNLSRAEVRSPLQLLDYGDDGLYLLDAQHVWRAEFERGPKVSADAPSSSNSSTNAQSNRRGRTGSQAATRLAGWSPVDISEITTRESDRKRSLPEVVRNYLPATDSRPYELLTVFDDRLYVYRRHENSPRWVLVSTLPTIDRSLHPVSGRDTVYLVGPDTIYRSRELGEHWQPLPLTEPPSDPPKINSVVYLPTDGAPDLPVLLAGTESGSIFRSNDGGDSWERLRAPDPDGRSITALQPGTAPDTVWAATDGEGILQSTDRGKSWRRRNSNLRASRPLDISIGVNGEFLAATDAGLFRLTGSPEDGHWDQFHPRATSAVLFDESTSRIVSGTLDGSLLTGGGEPTTKSGDIALSEVDDAPLFQPAGTADQLDRKPAVLSLVRRRNTEDLFAWTHEAGMLNSSDDGDTWSYLPLNPALTSALEQSVVSNFLAEPGGRMYLTSEAFESTDASQLWFSSNNGDSWHATHTFRETESEAPMLLRHAESAPPETLYLAHGDRLVRSRDAGSTWSTIPGPWNNGTIRAYSAEPDRHTLVYNDAHASRVVFATDLSERTPTTRNYELVWPGGRVFPDPNIRKLAAYERFVHLVTEQNIYYGAIPRGQSRLPHAPAIIITFLFLLIVTTFGFWYLRFS